MKQFKKLNATTKEGISFKNIELFPSMEWGDEGGQRANILYKGKIIGTYYQEGNGGCCNVYFDCDNETQDAYTKDLSVAVKRLETSHPELLADFDNVYDNTETLFCLLLDLHEHYKFYKKMIKKYEQYNIALAVMDYEWKSTCCIGAFTDDPSKDRFEQNVKNKYQDVKNYSFYYALDTFGAL